MAISGQKGSFLAGGKIFIPVAQSDGVGGGRSITLEEKEFGVSVRFTPTVLGNGSHQPRACAPEVSELNRDGVAISAPASQCCGAAVVHVAQGRDHRAVDGRPELRHRRADQEQHDRPTSRRSRCWGAAGGRRTVPQHRVPDRSARSWCSSSRRGWSSRCRQATGCRPTTTVPPSARICILRRPARRPPADRARRRLRDARLHAGEPMLRRIPGQVRMHDIQRCHLRPRVLLASQRSPAASPPSPDWDARFGDSVRARRAPRSSSTPMRPKHASRRPASTARPWPGADAATRLVRLRGEGDQAPSQTLRLVQSAGDRRRADGTRHEATDEPCRERDARDRVRSRAAAARRRWRSSSACR